MTERSEWIDLRYSVTFETPFHLGTGLPVGLIDHGIARERTADSDNGLLYIPASTLKGVIREQCERVAELAGLDGRDPYGLEGPNDSAAPHGEHPVDLVFGAPRKAVDVWFGDGRMAEEHRQQLQDARARAAPPVGWQSVERTRVALSRRRRTALIGRLFNLELGVPGLRFDARIHGRVKGPALQDCPQPVALPTVLLLAGLLMVERIGSQRSTGAGRCTLHVHSLTVDGVDRRPEELLQHLPTVAAAAAKGGTTE